MNRGILLPLGFLVLSACKSNVTEQGVLVKVENPLGVKGITNLQVTVSNQAQGKTLLFPSAMQTTEMAFPTRFSFTMSSGRSGRVDIVINGLAANPAGLAASPAVVANVAGSVVLTAGTFVPLNLAIQPGVSLCGNGDSNPGETCDDGNRVSGDGCDYLCQSEGAVNVPVDSGVADAPALDDVAMPMGEAGVGGEARNDHDFVDDDASGAGGTLGDGGAAGFGGDLGGGGSVGTGGTAGTGGAFGTGGAMSSGGRSGNGGIQGSGGTAYVECSPACAVDKDCVSGSCRLRPGACSSPADCTSSGTSPQCCDPTAQACAGTRIPVGDGTNTGQFAVSAADAPIVFDTITGLFWQRDGVGSRANCGGIKGGECPGGRCTCTWQEAVTYCSNLQLGGMQRWRLPSRMELRTIVDFTKSGPAIDEDVFSTPAQAGFWTSQSVVGTAGKAWTVMFEDGHASGASTNDYNWVRCVR